MTFLPESLLFVVGHPVSHSLSPAMHGAVIARRRLPLRYIPIDLPPERLPDFLRVVRAGNFLGGNVTIPHKGAAAELADERSEAVSVCGAANVLLVKKGRIVADNTDGDGFLDAVEGAGWGRSFRSVVILGAGGAARGVALSLLRSGTEVLTVLNRDVARAEGVATDLAARFPAVSFRAGHLTPVGMRNAFAGVDMVAQCTSLGLHGEWGDFPMKDVEKTVRVADIVYKPGGTALVRRLRRAGLQAIDGLPMLAYQAARSFRLWTSIDVTGEEYLDAARRAASGKRREGVRRNPRCQ